MDWKELKTEYITTETSYRKLSEKYNIAVGTLFKRAKKENWVALKERAYHNAVAKTVAVYEEKQAKKMERIMDATDRILDKIEQAINELDIQFAEDVTKTKTIEYNNDLRPDKPTKEIVNEKTVINGHHTIIDRAGIKAIASALKDIKEIQSLKSALDTDEQKARIQKLRRESDGKETEPVKIVISDETEEYST